MVLITAACGDDSPPGESEQGTGSSSGAVASTGDPPPGTTSGATGSGSGGGASTGMATEGSEGADSSGPPPVLLDVGVIPDAPPPACGGGGDDGDLELSYIWIANSAQGTISKIDTATMIEEGRYQAKPFNGDPSRTSVNLVGDVAVANRNGGVTKFWADPDDCISSNGVPGIQTSTGPGDVLAWGQDDCMAWHTALVCGSNRPVAWTRGTFNEAECTYEDMDLWTACDSQVLLLDGETGVIEETVPVPGGFPFMYGGAADADGNFWGIDTGDGRMIRVELGTLAYDEWPLPPSWGYGITVDSIGRPWVCGGGGVSRFDLVTETWDSAGGSGIGGCMTDGADLIWHSNNSGLLMGFNIDTLAIDEQIQLPEYVHGVSVDFQGNVWGVSFAGSNAYRANPTTGTVDVYGGLIGAYTYSDMTGHALSTVGGGGIPTG